MLWSGSSPLTVVRNGMWGLLLLTGVAWLAIGWSVLRLEPADIADIAGPVLLFAAATELVRAVAGSRTWWLNAGMALLFAATGAVLMTDRADSWTTPAALIGWYLLVRGAADIAIAMQPSGRSGVAAGRWDGTRETDRVWGLLTVVGLVELGLGFFAAGSFARTAEMVTVILGGAAVIRGVADLVASLRLKEASALARAERLLELPPERAVGVAGYAAGITDFEEAPPRGSRPRHRAAPATAQPASSGPGSFHDEVLRTTADLDAMLALAGVTGTGTPGAAARAAEAVQVEVPDTAEGVELAGPAQIGATPGRAEGADQQGAAPHGPQAMHAPAGPQAPGSLGGAPHSGQADTAMEGQGARTVAMPIWQDRREGQDPSPAGGHAPTGAPARGSSPLGDGPMPLLDPTAHAARAAMPGVDDTSIITRSRLVD
ncbi:hypothetical protein [Actinoplanes sp. NPDC049681]|uniref:hypothetical protein n=1 Tax=Actinoplanes sp. NPDC049681 TaxID=3363905 RepID=UPI0037B003C4